MVEVQMRMCVGEKLRFETKKLKSEKKMFRSEQKKLDLAHVGCLLLHLAAEYALSRTSRVKTRGLVESNSVAMKWKNTFSRHEEWRRTKCTAAMEPRRLTKRATRPVSVR